MNFQQLCASALSFEELPGAYFLTDGSTAEFGREAVAIEAAVTRYEHDLDECLLSETLGGLGFTPAEIAALANSPGRRPRCGYIS